jgi:ADP-ribose pyrophosphatase YjhB (NUDIX family)
MITCTFEKGFTDQLRHAVVHALVVQDGAILLGLRAGDLLESGKWGLPGGFLSLGETAGTGALRELYEETGWKGEIIRFFRLNSSPHRRREDRQNIVLEYLIKPLGHTGKTDWETAEIKFFPFDRLPASESIAFDHEDSIRLVAKYFRKPFTLPVIE